MLCQSTCVGVRYGHLRSYLGAFLGSVESVTSAPKSLAFASRRYVLRIYLQHRLPAWTRTSISALTYPPASPPQFIDFVERYQTSRVFSSIASLLFSHGPKDRSFIAPALDENPSRGFAETLYMQSLNGRRW